MAVNPNTTFTAGAVYTASQSNRFPRGVMGTATQTLGNLTVTTSVAALTGMTVTFTAEANRVYKATWNVTGQKITATGWIGVYLRNGATALGTVYQTPVINYYGNLSGMAFITTLTAGSQTLALWASAENNSFTVLANASDPCHLIIEDIGPA